MPAPSPALAPDRPTIRIDYQAYPEQDAVHSSRARFRTVCAGRRSGKTFLATIEAVHASLKQPGTRIAWAAPSYKVTRVLEETFFKLVHAPAQLLEYHKSEREFRWFNGSKIGLFSMDNPTGALGRSFDLVIVDEAAEVDTDAWTRVLRPTLSDRQGRGLFISTPLYRVPGHWFYDAWTRGNDPEHTDYASFHIPTSANPWIPKPEIEAARVDVPSEIFRQQYEAVFLDSSGAVFRGHYDCIEGYPFPGEPQPGRKYVAGIDLAKTADFTVCAILELGGDKPRLVALERWQDMPWPAQATKIAALKERWNWLEAAVDATGVGSAVVDDLRHNHGMFIRPIVFTHASKAQMVNELRLAFEQGTILLPPAKASRDVAVMFAELDAYCAKVTGAGTIQYSHPPGGHDDTVSALMLANSRAPYVGIPLGSAI